MAVGSLKGEPTAHSQNSPDIQIPRAINRRLWVRCRHRNAVDPVRDTAALGANIAQDGPDGHCAQNNGYSQDDNKLRNFRSGSFKQHVQSPFPSWGHKKMG
jgi:hypothetical protein